MRPRARRQRHKSTQVEDLERIIELLEIAHARGDLDDPDTVEHVARLKKLAAQLPAVAGNETRWLRLVKAAKAEIYDLSTTLIAKIFKEFS